MSSWRCSCTNRDVANLLATEKYSAGNVEMDTFPAETRAARVGQLPAPSALRVAALASRSETDLIMLVMNARGAEKLLSSKFTLGAEGSVAAGPVGRTATAQTDAQMHAEILSWSRSQGLFAGLALEGAHPAAGSG